MFSTVHGTTGAIIGKCTGNIFAGFFLAILMHFIFDIIPHGDEKLIKDSSQPSRRELNFVAIIATLDMVIMLLILGGLAYLGYLPANYTIAFSILGGILPDAVNAFYILTKIKLLKPLLTFHEKIHRLIKIELTLAQGLVFQILIEVLLVIWLIR